MKTVNSLMAFNWQKNGVVKRHNEAKYENKSPKKSTGIDKKKCNKNKRTRRNKLTQKNLGHWMDSGPYLLPAGGSPLANGPPLHQCRIKETFLPPRCVCVIIRRPSGHRSTFAFFFPCNFVNLIEPPCNSIQLVGTVWRNCLNSSFFLKKWWKRLKLKMFKRGINGLIKVLDLAIYQRITGIKEMKRFRRK